MAIDEAKLNDFMGRFVGDLGAVMHAATIVVGDQLGLYKALADKPQTAERARQAHRDRRALRARVALGPGGERLRHVRPGERHLQPERGAGVRARRRRQPGLHPGRVPDRGRAVQGDPEDDAGVSHRPRPRLARARRGALPRHRALLPAGLRGQPRRHLDPGARRRGGAPEGRRQRRRRRLRPRRLDDHHGPGLSRRRRSSASTTTSPRSRTRARRRRRPASATASASRSRARRAIPATTTTW